MYKIHISQIVKIAEDRLYYRDDRGDIAWIDLSVCANNYAAKHHTSDQPAPKLRCVGERVFGDYAYYELYTIGRTQIYMHLKTNIIKRMISKVFSVDFRAREFRKFYTLHKQFNANGWTTLDLT